MSKQTYLGDFEQKILWAAVRLGGEAYGMAVKRMLAEREGKDVSVGAVYATLDRLESKGLVSSEWGEPLPERGGRRRRYYRVEPAGAAALEQSRKVMTKLWRGLKPVKATRRAIEALMALPRPQEGRA